MEFKNISGKRIAMLAHTYYMWDQRVRREAEALAEAGAIINVICLNEKIENKKFIKPKLENVNGVNICRVPIGKTRGSSFRYLIEYIILAIIGMWILIKIQLKQKINVLEILNFQKLCYLGFFHLISLWYSCNDFMVPVS